jgi:hypothetical protein
MPVLKNPPPVAVPQMLAITANGAIQMKAAWIGPVVDLGPVVQRLRDSVNNPLGPYSVDDPAPSRALTGVTPVHQTPHAAAHPAHTAAEVASAKGKYPRTRFYTDGRLNEQYVHDIIADCVDCSDLVVISHASTVGSSSHMKADEVTKNFGDFDSNPLGRSPENVLTVDLTQEFNAAQVALGGPKK